MLTVKEKEKIGKDQELLVLNSNPTSDPQNRNHCGFEGGVWDLKEAPTQIDKRSRKTRTVNRKIALSQAVGHSVQ